MSEAEAPAPVNRYVISYFWTSATILVMACWTMWGMRRALHTHDWVVGLAAIAGDFAFLKLSFTLFRRPWTPSGIKRNWWIWRIDLLYIILFPCLLTFFAGLALHDLADNDWQLPSLAWNLDARCFLVGLIGIPQIVTSVRRLRTGSA